jgi:hypothetical protein
VEHRHALSVPRGDGAGWRDGSQAARPQEGAAGVTPGCPLRAGWLTGARALAHTQVLLQLLASSDEDACTAAAEVLAELLGPGRVGEDPAAEGPALQRAVEHLVGLMPGVQVGGGGA